MVPLSRAVTARPALKYYLCEVRARRIRNGKKRYEGRPFDGVRACGMTALPPSSGPDE